MENKTLIIDGKETSFTNERNLLEVIRAAQVELPTFCYHSELSVYGACRLCMVDLEGRGMVPACSTPPEAGMKVRTNTEEIREMRRIIVELLLADHEQKCPTCPKSNACKLQDLARRLGVRDVRFKATKKPVPRDVSTRALERDPNKCVLCGDCVRICEEVQSVGAIDFAWRGSRAAVIPAFGKNLDRVECVYCGQCARVCPTGAITPKSEVEDVWKALDDSNKVVVAQIAPAVRVALGETFGLPAGTSATGQITAALRRMGFKKVFDTSFAADLTVIEESAELGERLGGRGAMPLFTSCCPAWVKFAEQYYPEFVSNISTCRSPQQMFGAFAKDSLPALLNVPRESVTIVSIMPCTAKKFEAHRPEFAANGARDVDHVITTQELARMIEEAGISFNELEPESMDMPFGFKTGAGVIFGNSGGVSEAVVRYLSGQSQPGKQESMETVTLKNGRELRSRKIELNGRKVSIAVVHGLANARALLEEIKAGTAAYDFIEVMACPGGCVGGAGQPVCADSAAVRARRTKGLVDNDRMLQLHKPQDNPYIAEMYKKRLGKPGGEKAHKLLHTHYGSKRRTSRMGMVLIKPKDEKPVEIDVCFGTGCFMKGSQKLLSSIIGLVNSRGMADSVGVKASFCFEKCAKGPVVRIGGKTIEACTIEKAAAALDEAVAKGAATDGK